MTKIEWCIVGVIGIVVILLVFAVINLNSMSEQRQQKVFEAGKAAAQAGLEIHDNPHNEWSSNKPIWQRGWVEGSKDER